jgi:hypothetical protein
VKQLKEILDYAGVDAYETFGEATNWKHRDGSTIPKWEELSVKERQKWDRKAVQLVWKVWLVKTLMGLGKALIESNHGAKGDKKPN